MGVRLALRAAASAFFLSAIAARWLNFSTRPAVSRNFCCPVQSGWQLEQTSTLMDGDVDPVVNEFPHAHVTRASGYHLG